MLQEKWTTQKQWRDITVGHTVYLIFALYLTTLSVAHIIYCRMTGKLVNYEFQTMFRGQKIHVTISSVPKVKPRTSQAGRPLFDIRHGSWASWLRNRSNSSLICFISTVLTLIYCWHRPVWDITVEMRGKNSKLRARHKQVYAEL
jgi:hypothetical protein